jgi:hypothetical protein
MVELGAKGCTDPKNPVPTTYQCIAANLAWYKRDLGVEETMRRLTAAGCACTLRGDDIRCASHRPITGGPARPPAPTPASIEECRKLLDFIANTKGIMKGATGEALKHELRSKGCRIPR